MKARLPQGYGKAPANNMNSMIKQAQKMQEELAKKQAELDEMEFSTTAGGGVVTVVMNGKKEMKSHDAHQFGHRRAQRRRHRDAPGPDYGRHQ